jgi:hypothetical protein
VAVAKGKSGKKKGKASRDGAARVTKLPKNECCESKTQCGRCPLRMLREGTLPQGYTVHKRKLVTVEKAARIRAAKHTKKPGQAA